MTVTDPLISAATRASLIDIARRWMVAVLQIEHTPLVSDGRGGDIPETPTLTTTPGNIYQSGTSAAEQQIADRVSGRTLWIIEVPLDTPIDAARDRILEPSSGRAFEIIQPLPATDNVTLPIACVEAT